MSRSIPDSQRAFGLGMQLTFARIFGSIPGPVVFGAVIDNTCILWQESGEDESGNSCALRRIELLNKSAFNFYLSLLLVCNQPRGPRLDYYREAPLALLPPFAIHFRSPLPLSYFPLHS